MKRIYLIIGFLICAIHSFAQYTINQSIGSGNTRVFVPANGAFQASLINRTFADTAAANLTPIDFYAGAQIYTTSDNRLWLRNSAATAWVQVASGTISSANIYNSDGVLTAHRRLTGNNNTYSLDFDSLASFEVRADVGVQYAHLALGQFLAHVSYVGNPYTSELTATNGNISMGIIGGNEVSVSGDSIRIIGTGKSNDTTDKKIQTINPITGAIGYSNWIGSGSGGTPAGNNHNVQLNRVGSFYGSDSLLFNGLGLINLSDYTGRSLKLSDATASIHNLYIGGVKYLSNYGPTLDNLWLGKNSGSASAVATNSQNIGIGINTLQNVQSQGNIAIGTVAGADFTAAAAPTTDIKNIFIGYEAGTHATGGQNNIAIGSNAGQNFQNGSFSNTAVGKVALGNCTTCNANSIYGASIQLTTGTWNALVGADIMTGGTSASFNAGVGAFSFASATTASYNAWVGYTAGGNCTTCTGNSLLGEHALSSVTTGNYNIAIGNFAGAYNSNASYQFIIHAENKGSVSKALVGGDLQNYKAAINVREDSVLLLPYTFQVNGNMSLHHTNFTADTTSHKPIVWNTTTGLFERSYWAAGGGATTPAGNNNNLQINRDGAFYSPLLDTLTYRTDSGLIVRNDAFINTARLGRGLAANITNTVFGVSSGNAFTSGTQNTFFGYHTGLAVTSGSSNTGVGQSVLASLQGGGTNTAIGNGSMGIVSSGSSNVAVGASTLVSLTTASGNTAIGTLALQVATGGTNTATGYQSGLNVTTGTLNAIFGYNTGIGITTGSGNLILGPSVTGLTSSLTNNIRIASGGGVKASHDGTDWTLTGAVTLTNGSLTLGTAGNKINITTGTNASAGVSAAMTAGSITISTTAVTANSIIILTPVGAGTGSISKGTVTAGTSFVINSSDGADTRTVQWLIIN